MFGNEAKTLRLRCGLSQQALAVCCGSCASTIGMIEQGRRLPSPVLYARLRDTFAAHGYRLAPRPHKPCPRCDPLRLLGE